MAKIMELLTGISEKDMSERIAWYRDEIKKALNAKDYELAEKLSEELTQCPFGRVR